MEENTKVKEKIKELREKGIPIYSISKLSTLDNCYYEFYQTYILKLQQVDNVYSFFGSKVHKCLEDLQNGEKVDFIQEINKAKDDANMLDLKFPSDKIGDKFINNIMCFAKNYSVPKLNKFKTEELFLVKIEGKYVQGIIDLLIFNEDGSVDIIDYKTSSKFSNAELPIKGRQLILYGLACEELGYKVNSLAWNMLKYVEISYKLKNGKIKSTVAERGYIIEKLKNDIIKRIKANTDLSDLEIEMLVDEAVEQNSFDVLPAFIREAYEIKDYIVKYEYSQDNIEELKKYIKAKADEIESFQDDESWWEPKEITKFTSFFCENLCGHKEHCEYYQEYLENQRYFDSVKEDNELDDELKNFI